MSDRSSKGHKSAERAVNPSPLGAKEFWSPAVASGAEWNKKFHENLVALSSEWQGFVSRRLEEDMHLARGLVTAKAADEAWKVYANFWQRAVEDYWQEYAVLAARTGALMGSEIEATRHGGEESAAATPQSKAA